MRCTNSTGPGGCSRIGIPTSFERYTITMLQGLCSYHLPGGETLANRGSTNRWKILNRVRKIMENQYEMYGKKVNAASEANRREGPLDCSGMLDGLFVNSLDKMLIRKHNLLGQKLRSMSDMAASLNALKQNLNSAVPPDRLGPAENSIARAEQPSDLNLR